MDPMLLTVALGGVLLGALVGAGIWQAMVSSRGRHARQLVAAAARPGPAGRTGGSR